jgi:sugar lactone lactonase YvrE
MVKVFVSGLWRTALGLLKCGGSAELGPPPVCTCGTPSTVRRPFHLPGFRSIGSTQTALQDIGSRRAAPALRRYSVGHLIQVGGDGRASILDEGIHIANGLGFSPDCQILYFTDSAARCIYAYDYDVERGSARNRRVVIKVPENEGLPDGMTVDAEGFIWSAQWYGSGVVRYDPEGRVERRIAVLAKQTSSVAFGGEDLTDIFITSASRSYPTPLMPHGYNPSSGYCGGRLYHMNLGIRGKPEFKTNLCLPPTRPKC